MAYARRIPGEPKPKLDLAAAPVPRRKEMYPRSGMPLTVRFDHEIEIHDDIGSADSHNLRIDHRHRPGEQCPTRLIHRDRSQRDSLAAGIHEVCQKFDVPLPDPENATVDSYTASD